MTELKHRIRQARKRLGLNLLELADRVGVTSPAIRRWEIDTMPGPSNLQKLSRALGVHQTWLLTGEGQMVLPKSETDATKREEHMDASEMALNEMQVIVEKDRIRVTACVDGKGVKRLQDMLEANERFLETANGKAAEAQA